MTPESICVSLTTAKLLKEKGWPQKEALFFWEKVQKEDWKLTELSVMMQPVGSGEDQWPILDEAISLGDSLAAPTAGELWEASRKLSPDKDVHLETCFGCTEACVKATTCSFEDVPWFEGKTPQEALA